MDLKDARTIDLIMELHDRQEKDVLAFMVWTLDDLEPSELAAWASRIQLTEDEKLEFLRTFAPKFRERWCAPVEEFGKNILSECAYQLTKGR